MNTPTGRLGDSREMHLLENLASGKLKKGDPVMFVGDSICRSVAYKLSTIRGQHVGVCAKGGATVEKVLQLATWVCHEQDVGKRALVFVVGTNDLDELATRRSDVSVDLEFVRNLVGLLRIFW